MVLEGDLWNEVSEGEYNVTTWEPARRYRVVSADSSVDRSNHFDGAATCQVLCRFLIMDQ